MTPRWLVDWDEAGRRRQARLAGRPVEPHVWREEWAPTPSMDRSVHMRPAETEHPTPVSGRAGSAIGRSLGWLLARSGFGGPMG